MRLTRRRFLGGAAAGVLAGAGVYELVDQLTPAPTRHGSVAGLPVEQHVIDLGLVELDGVEVVVPPLHSEVVTGTLKTSNLRAASPAIRTI